MKISGTYTSRNKNAHFYYTNKTILCVVFVLLLLFFFLTRITVLVCLIYNKICSIDIE